MIMHSATLQWKTEPSGQFIVEHARASADPEVKSRPDEDLLNFLIRERHWSPFEQENMAVKMLTTRRIGRQMIRHPSLRPQEFSQRYQDIEVMERHGPYVEVIPRKRHGSNRQQSVFSMDPKLREEWNDRRQGLWNYARSTYDWAKEQGIALEQAADVLPEGITPTLLYMNGTIRSWIHFCWIRTYEEGAQREAEWIASDIRNLLYEHYPVVATAAFGKRKNHD